MALFSGSIFGSELFDSDKVASALFGSATIWDRIIMISNSMDFIIRRLFNLVRGVERWNDWEGSTQV